MPTSNRRALHQPFFPLFSISPPTEPPSFPKYPFSSTNSRPFFPIYPSPPPPPPPPSSIHTFPANISSLVSPSQRTLPSSSKLLLAIALPLLSLALLFLTLAFFFFHHCRRRKRSSVKNDFGSDSHHLFPPNSTASDSRKLSDTSAPASTEFLYLGTLVNSRGHVADESSGTGVGPTSAGSPELRPLPPLVRQIPRHGEGGYSSEDEFYSPRDFPGGEKRNPGGPASSSRREECGSQSPVSTLSTPLFPSSKTASSPSRSSPTALIKSPSFRTNRVAAGDIGFKPPPPKPMLRPRTLSPPKRKPPSPSPPNSPPEKRSDFSSQTLRSPRRSIGDFPRNPFANGPPQIQPPPPPSPLPPVGYWESHPSKFLAGQPPVLVPPKPIGLKNSTAAVFPAESPENSDAGEKGEEHPRPKLKPLHWDKVRASSERAMVWDHLKSSSFQLNEEMIETLFVCDSAKATSEVGTRRQVLPAPIQEYMVLDPKKSQNIAILLRALNVTKEEVCEALLEGNTDSLGNELLETLLKMAPSKEEEIKLKEYKDDSPFKLGPAEKFLKSMLDIPFAFKRVDAMLYIANFDSEVNYLKKSFETLELACEELRSSRLFRKLLDAVLKAGNRMNVGTNRGDAQAFKLNTLLKLIDIKSTDSKTTLLHFVVQEISRAEGSRLSAANPSSVKPQTNTLRDDLECKMLGLQVVSGLGAELSNVKKAGIMDSEILSSYVSELAGGMGKIREVVRLNEVLSLVNSSLQFHEAMSGFLRMAEGEITKLQAQESIALSAVKEITEYFHGDLAKEEAHPFRIFMVVKDFLSFLDQVCKEVARINEHSVVSSARQFPVLASTGVPQDLCYEAWEF